MLVTSQVLMVLSFIMTLTMTIFQLLSAKKPPGPDNAAAEARKGYEMVVDGKPDNLSVIYGRAKVGGIRTFQETASDFYYVEPNGNKTWATGVSKSVAIPYTTILLGTATDYNGELVAIRNQLDAMGEVVRDPDTNEPITVPIVDVFVNKPSTQLDQDFKSNRRNQFLYFQQAICVGEINNIIDVIMDESKYLDNPALGTYGKVPGSNNYTAEEAPEKTKWQDITKPRSALRIDLHHKKAVDADGNNIGFEQADSIITRNFPDKSNSRFKGLSYASAVFRLDRDDPQFSGVPNLQFLVEGRLVKQVDSSGALTATATYSNNPAWCLLDYLISKEYGAGVDFTSEIDGKSFYDAAQSCKAIVQKDIVVGGKIWNPTDKSFTAVKKRNLPLYECNIVIDTKKPVRENIEVILATMADARLIWASGKYKLSLQYPGLIDSEGLYITPQNNDNIVVATTLTDDDLVMDQDVEITWPSAADRLNHCVVKFHNEAEDFKEDSASWPPKFSSDKIRGIGGFRYPDADFSWTEEKEGVVYKGGMLLNKYGVWSGTFETTTLEYIFIVKKEDVQTSSNGFTLEFTGDSTATVEILNANGTQFLAPTTHAKKTTTKKILNLSFGNSAEDRYYTIKITAANADDPKYAPSSNNDKGVAATIYTANKVFWSTRSPAFTGADREVVSNLLYTNYKETDSDLELELEIFADGITDRYHALARAEELVRTSRSAYSVKFKYILREVYLEPGDFIKLDSVTLQILTAGDTSNYFRVNSVKIGEDSTCEVTAQHFNYDQLAWSVKNSESIIPPNYSPIIKTGPQWLNFEFVASRVADSSGSLIWEPVTSAKVNYYILSMYVLNGEKATYVMNENTNSVPIFNRLGQSTSNTFVLPVLSATNAVFSVEAVFMDGSMSKPTYTDEVKAVYLNRAAYTFKNLGFSISNLVVTWTTFDLYRNGNLAYPVSGGSGTWNDTGDLLIYLDLNVIPNVVRTSTNRSALLNNKLLAIYKGGTTVFTTITELNPPINLKVNGINSSTNIAGQSVYTFVGEQALISWECNKETLRDTSNLAGYLLTLSDELGFIAHTETLPVGKDATKSGSFLVSKPFNELKFGGKGSRRFTVSVSAVDLQGTLAEPALMAVVTNLAPVIPVLETEVSYKSVYLKASMSSLDTDTLTYTFRRYATETSITPLDTVVSTDTYLYYLIEPNKTYWYSVTASDLFGEGSESVRKGISSSGEIARAVKITLNNQFIIYKADGTKQTPASNFIVTARLSEGSISDFYFEFYIDNAIQTANVVNNVFTLTPSTTYSTFSAGTGNSKLVSVRLYSASDHDTLLSSDVIEIYALKIGSDVIQPILSNPYQMLPVNIDGSVSMTDSPTSLDVYYGSSQLTYSSIDVSSPGVSNNRYSVTTTTTNVFPETLPLYVSTNGLTSYTLPYTRLAYDSQTASVLFTIKVKNSLGVISTQTVTQNLTKQFASNLEAQILALMAAALSNASTDITAVVAPTFDAIPIVYVGNKTTGTAKDDGKYDGTVNWGFTGNISDITGFVIYYQNTEVNTQVTPTYEEILRTTEYHVVTSDITSYTIKDLGQTNYTCVYIFAYRAITKAAYDTLTANKVSNAAQYWIVSNVVRSHENGSLSNIMNRYAISTDIRYEDKIVLASHLSAIGDDYNKDNNALTNILSVSVTDTVVTDFSIIENVTNNRHPGGGLDIILSFKYSGLLTDIDGFAILDDAQKANTAIADLTAKNIVDDKRTIFITTEDVVDTNTFYVKFFNVIPTQYRTYFITPVRTVPLKATYLAYYNALKLATNKTTADGRVTTKDKLYVCMGPVTRSHPNTALYQPMANAVFDGYVQTDTGLLSIKNGLADFNRGNSGSVTDITTVIPSISVDTLSFAGTSSALVDVTCTWEYATGDETAIDGFIVALSFSNKDDDTWVTTLPVMKTIVNLKNFATVAQTERTYTFKDMPTKYYYNFIIIPIRIINEGTYKLLTAPEKANTLTARAYKLVYPFLFPTYTRTMNYNMKYTRMNTQSILEPTANKGDYWLNTNTALATNTTTNGAYPFRISIYNGTSWDALTAAEIKLKEAANFPALIYENDIEPANEVGFVWKNTSTSSVSGVGSKESVIFNGTTGLWEPITGGRKLKMTIKPLSDKATTDPLEGDLFLTSDVGDRTIYLARDGAWKAMRDLQTVLVDTYPTAAMVLANPAYVSTTTKITAALAKANTEYGSTKPTAITSYPKLLQYLYYPAPKANVTTVIGMIYYKRTQTTNAWQEVLLSDKKTIASIGVPIKV